MTRSKTELDLIRQIQALAHANGVKYKGPYNLRRIAKFFNGLGLHVDFSTFLYEQRANEGKYYSMTREHYQSPFDQPARGGAQ